VDDVHVMAVKPISEKYAILKCKGGTEYFAGDGPQLVAVADKVKGQDCAVEADPPKDGKSAALRKLVVKETGEVVYTDAGRSSGKGRAPGSYAKDPAERASIEAQSALSHSLQEVRMAKDLLLGIVAAVAPYEEGITKETALAFVKEHLEPVADEVRAYREKHMGALAASLAATRAANMGPSGSGSQGAGPGPSAGGGAGNRGSKRSASPPSSPAPGDGGRSTGAAGDGPGEPSSGPDASPTGIAAKQAAVLAKFKTLAAVKAAADAAFGEKLSPGQMSEAQLDGLLSEEAKA
jgi:hypothetical protein